MELRPQAHARLTPGPPRTAALSGRWPALVGALVLLLAVVLVAAPAASAQELEQPSSQDRAPAGYELSAREVIEIARGTEEVATERRDHQRLEPTAYTNGYGRWQVSFMAGEDEVAQVHVDDRTREVLEAWTGPQVAWKMARGYPGAFGGRLNAWYVWLPLCAVFLLPFVDPRRPFRMLHLDLLVLISFTVSHHLFNRGEIFWSVPLAYPVLAYLLLRMLWIGFRPRGRPELLVPLVPVTALALGVLFLVGFRIAFNVVESNVIDVGYASVVGADVIAGGNGLYDDSFPEDLGSGDTYGAVNYLAYLPFEQIFPWGGDWDELPAAHAAAIAFDALTILGLFLLGRRLRAGPEGRMLGVALAFAWASYPYTAFVLESNANDTLVAMLMVFALLAVTSAPARGFFLGLAGAAKFAPLALAPLFARGVDPRGTEERRGRDAAAEERRNGGGRTDRRRARFPARGPVLFAVTFFATLAAVVLVFMPDGGPRELYDRTVGYQAGRDSPFSIWGQVPSLNWLQTAMKAAAVALGVLVALVPRRRGPVQLAALGAAVLIAVQLTIPHWFYLYVVWFAPLVFVALFGRYRSEPRRAPPAAEEAGRQEDRAAVAG